MTGKKTGRVIEGVKDVGVLKTSKTGVVALSFTLEGEGFAIALPDRMAAKIMIQLVALLGGKKKGKTGGSEGPAIPAARMEFFPQEGGDVVLLFDIDGVEVPIRLSGRTAAQFLAQSEQAFAGETVSSMDVDHMLAQSPNPLETDRRFRLRTSSGGNHIDMKFGRDRAELLHAQLSEFLNHLPPRKTH